MIVPLALLAMLQQTAPPAATDKSYLFFVAVEGRDEVALLRFDRKGLRVEHRTPIGSLPGEPESPGELYRVDVTAPTFPALNGRTVLLSSAHGFAPERLAAGPRHLALSPDGRWYYVTTARGFPTGTLLKVRIAADSAPVPQPPDTVRGQEQLGADPDAVAISRDGLFAWVTAGAEGEIDRSGVSIIYLAPMTEVGHVATCGGARGARFTVDGSRHYSVCTANDALVEIDARAMKVTRQLSLGASDQRRCGPTALTTVPDGSRIFVACGQSGEVVEVDGLGWSVGRRLPVGAGPASLAITDDGSMLVVVDREGGGISLLDMSAAVSGRPAATVQVSANYRQASVAAPGVGANGARVDLFDLTAIMLAAAGFGTPLPALQGTPIAAVTSSDQRYAFVTVARSGGETGTITVIDLAARLAVASLDFGRRPAGIAFWKVVP